MQSLPAHWVEKIFARLTGVYGTVFTNRFATGIPMSGCPGTDTGIENAKQVWGEELAGFHGMPEAIAYALRNTDPKFPPSAKEFAVLCRLAPRVVVPSLPAPEPTPEQRQAHQAALRDAVAKAPGYDCRGWARQLRTRYLAGEKLCGAQIERAGSVLGEVWANGRCQAVAEVQP